MTILLQSSLKKIVNSLRFDRIMATSLQPHFFAYLYILGAWWMGDWRGVAARVSVIVTVDVHYCSPAGRYYATRDRFMAQ